MKPPKLGALCLFENPSAEDGRALIRQFVLVREADRMGYDEIWVAEQHGDRHHPSGAIIALLGHLAGVTSKARIGALPLLPALHDAARLAEDLATVDQLSKGRLNIGLASGAAFPATLARHGIAPGQAAERLRQALALLQQQLGHAQTVPQPAQPTPALWLASDDPATLALAGAQGLGLIAAATHTESRIRQMREAYGSADARLVLARYGCSAATHDAAVAIARPFFEALASRAQAAGWGGDKRRSMAQDVDALLAQSLVGSHAEVAARIKRLGAELGVASVAIAPTSAQFDTTKHILADFVDEVRPLLDED